MPDAPQPSDASATLRIAGRTYFTEPAKIEDASLGFLRTDQIGVALRFGFKNSMSSVLSAPAINARCAGYLTAVLDAAGVEQWADLVGKKVLVLREIDNRYGYLVGFTSRKHPQRAPLVQTLLLAGPALAADAQPPVVAPALRP